MESDRIVFHGTLAELLDKVERGEMVPRLQASHAPPCKFWTAFQVLDGIRHMVPVIHGPKGWTYSVAASYEMPGCEYHGVPFEPTACTAQSEVDVVYGGEGKLLEAVREADRRYKPDLIVILCSGSFMSLYAANNIAKGVQRLARRGEAGLAGIICNSAGDEAFERRVLRAFATAFGTELVATVPRSPVIQAREVEGRTVLEHSPHSQEAEVFRALASQILARRTRVIPTPIEDISELEALYRRHLA